MTIKVECAGCEGLFKPIYNEQMYCEDCREETPEGVGWQYDETDRPTEDF